MPVTRVDGAARTHGSTDVSVALGNPSGSSATLSNTMPSLVVRASSPVSPRSARATPLAMVAWPQNGTSANGLKYRTRKVPVRPDPAGARKAVSE